MDYDTVLTNVVSSIEELEREVDIEVRKEFTDYSDRLDEVLDVLRTMDKTDFIRLTSQLMHLHSLVNMGTRCPCTKEARWHACLGRVESAIDNAADRCKRGMVNILVEDGALPQEIADELLQTDYQMTDVLPDLPSNTEIPNDVSELTKDA